MAKFKLSVSIDDGKVQNMDVEGDQAQLLLGKMIGDTVDGTALGLSQMKLEITGGSDKDGFPMRRDVHGGVRSMILMSKGVGFHATRKGERKRKLVRGNIITEDTAQINFKILKG